MWTDQEQLAIRPVRSEVHVFKGDALGDGYISELRDKVCQQAQHLFVLHLLPAPRNHSLTT